MKNDVRCEYVPKENVWFCLISIVWVHFSNKTEEFEFWKSFQYFNIFWQKKDMVSDLDMCLRKMTDIVSSPLFGFTLVIKLSNFDFESHWNKLIFFDQKRYGVGFEYGKISDFVSYPLFGFSFVIKLINFDFKGH